VGAFKALSVKWRLAGRVFPNLKGSGISDYVTRTKMVFIMSSVI
jgi:hypothetical protein